MGGEGESAEVEGGVWLWDIKESVGGRLRREK
jgi:hypothetical protein